MFDWLLTRKINCPDGSTKIVYHNVDKAFPLVLKTSKTKFSTELKALKEATAKMSSEYASKVEGILFKISEQNESLMMDFRSTYFGFQSDPCSDHGFFKRQVERLQIQQHQLSLLKIKVNALVVLVKENPGNSELIVAFQDIINSINGQEFIQLAKSEIIDNREVAKKWIGEQNG